MNHSLFYREVSLFYIEIFFKSAQISCTYNIWNQGKEHLKNIEMSIVNTSNVLDMGSKTGFLPLKEKCNMTWLRMASLFQPLALGLAENTQESGAAGSHR